MRAIGDKHLSDDPPYQAEYARSGRSKCRRCRGIIVNNELRFAVLVQSCAFDGPETPWFHFHCFFKEERPKSFADIRCSLRSEDVTKIIEKIESAGNSLSPVKDDVDGPSSSKKIKIVEEHYEQNKRMYAIRDFLTHLPHEDLKHILHYNRQPYGPEKPQPSRAQIRDRVADIMAFGALAPCPKCGCGVLEFCEGQGYRCTAKLDWSNCTYVDEKPKREPCKIPEDLHCFPFLKNYSSEVQDRLIYKIAPAKVDGGTVMMEGFTPLRGMSFFITDETALRREELESEISRMGGMVSKKLLGITAVVSTQAMVDQMDELLSRAKQLDIPVVPESFIEACKTGNVMGKIKEMKISPWGPGSEDLKSLDVKVDGLSHFKNRPSTSIVKIKGNSAVAPGCYLGKVAHVHEDDEGAWGIDLTKVDVQKNKNSFYSLQLLARDKVNDAKLSNYWVFRSWGRVGTRIGGKKTEKYRRLKDAKLKFEGLFREKTGNQWRMRDTFEKYPNKYYPVDRDYEEILSQVKESSVPSSLSEPVQELIKMLLDVERMRKVMLELEIDLDKMPLGKLSKRRISKAYEVLAELKNGDGSINSAKVLDCTNKFYTLIPHSFGVKPPPLLEGPVILQEKLAMLESLSGMEFAYKLVEEAKDDPKRHHIDAFYSKLECHLSVVEKNSVEFKDIIQYVKNSHSPIHSNYVLDVLDVFSVSKANEDVRYKPFEKLHNKKLLWHGSRITNFAGILSQGLRVAPPEAPASGAMYGPGIYFADVVSKSANYCRTSNDNRFGLLLLCEVALGDMYETTKKKLIKSLPSGKHSCKALGKTVPTPAESIITSKYVEIPNGTLMQSTRGTALDLLRHNEYIVYDNAQVKMRYLVKVEFTYKR